MSSIRAEIKEAIALTSGRGLMVAPGCVLSIETPPEHILAARMAVEI
jgi:hypothetical protein